MNMFTDNCGKDENKRTTMAHFFQKSVERNTQAENYFLIDKNHIIKSLLSS